MKRSFIKLVLMALFAGGMLAAAEPSSEKPLTVKGGRFLTLNTVIRVNQIEAARNLNEGSDEAAIHTPETVAAFRDAVSKGFPGAAVTWAFSWQALHDERPNYVAIRKQVVGYHKTYGDEITFIPGGFFAPMYSSRAQVNQDIKEALLKVREMVGDGYKPKSLVAGFLAAENLRYLAEEEGIHVCQGTIWSQYGIDNGDGDGSISYPYYPSREHACKPAQGKADFIDCVNLDGWTCDFLCARRFGFDGGFNSRLGVGPIESYRNLGVEKGMAEVMAVTANHFDDGFARNGFGWVANCWEISLVKGLKPEALDCLAKWLQNVRQRWPDTRMVTQGEFGEAWRREHPDNQGLNYKFVQRGTGIGGSETNLEIRWFMNADFRLALLRDWQKDEPGKVIDFTRYDLPAREPADPTAAKPSRNWSLINRINQKGRRPQDKPVRLGDLPAADLALIGKRYPELLAAGSRMSPFLGVTLSSRQPAIESLAVDGLGHGKCNDNTLHPPADAAVAFKARATAGGLEYRRPNTPDDVAPGWTIETTDRTIRFVSQYSAMEQPGPVVCNFDTTRCHTTLLGLFQKDGRMSLPAVLHLPGHGTFRVTGPGALGYESGRAFVKVTFPAATAAMPRVEYRLEVATIFPSVAGIDSDPRFDGFRRNWLNVLQLNPSRRVLSNHAASDTCGFCYYKYADIALQTPPLGENLTAMDVVRQSIEQVLAGTKTYGMPGYGDFPEVTADTYPSLIIAAYDCTLGNKDQHWLETHYAGIRQWADKMLATDRQGNGLIKYDSVTGNSGSWNEGQPKKRPSNWWDTIGFGHEDAYANALAYRALRSLEIMATALNNRDDAARYRAAAEKLRAAYFDAFYNPATGVLAGWRSADGQLHDYYFLFVNGIAIHYGLVPKDKANAIMDRLLAKMREVGYTRFDLGLPGNLISVARKDYAHKDPRFGGGLREDNADGFQRYENGGATACFAYFTLAALYDLGRREEADRMLMPMLQAFEQGKFEGKGANGLSNDWRAWDGTAWGYEGFLVDNYYALLAVLARDNAAKPKSTSNEIGP